MTRISVCMPTYNGSKYVAEQLNSILSQLGPTDEVIISDDGSTDNTLDIIHNIHDDRIKILSHKKTPSPFKGTYKTIYTVYKHAEHALQHANGKYIFLSTQDVIFLPNKYDLVLHQFYIGT